MIDSSYIAAKPEDVGIDPEKLEAVFARAQRDVEGGLLPSAQVAVARHGKVAGMRTIGAAVQDGVEKPATDETLYCIFSCTKAIVASAMWLLFEDGNLKLEETVADVIPEFGTNGKEVITVEELMLHTGGFPYAPFAGQHWGDRDALLDAFSRWRLNWEPDSRYEYHPTSAHWVMTEIIYRRGGMDFRDFIRQRVTGPMGLPELFVGMPEEFDPRVAQVCYIGEIVEPPGGFGEVTPEAIMRFNGPTARRSGIPGAGAHTSAADLAMFYQALINGGTASNGNQILKPETIEFATKVRSKDRHRDLILDIPVNRALSVIVAGDDGNAFMRGFGRCTSGKAFGHGGAGGQMGWGDPETGISLGYCTNGFNDYLTIGRRITAISSLAASCAV